MKPRATRLLALLLTCLPVASLLQGEPAWAADTPTPTPGQSSSPAPTDAPKRGAKRNAPADSTPKPPRVKKAKEFSFPLPPGESANGAKIPQLGMAGELLSQMMAAKITRLDNERVEMHETKIDLYHPDGKEDFHVVLPDSIFNLKTNVISSDHPVIIRTQDFELTGERMEFNTVDRTGELQGHVHMVIHNFKQVAGVIPTTPAP